MNSINKVIIIGTNHHNTLSMVRCFGEEGRKVSLYIYGDDNSYIALSKYVEEVYYFKTAEDAVDQLVRKVDSTIKPLIIACSDDASSMIDKFYDQLNKNYHFFNAGCAGRITRFMNKQLQMKVAANCGFDVPNTLESLPNDIQIDSINYPCIIKPAASIYGGKNISVCYTKESLDLALKSYPAQFNVLVQDFIVREYEIVILGASYNQDFVIPGYIHKHRDDKGGTTYCTVKPISSLPHELVESCKQLITTIGYNGLWGIECIKSNKGYYFLELNLRNDATTYAMKVAGVNLPLIYLQLEESLFDNRHHLYVQSIQSIVEFNDFNFVLKGKVGLLKWIRQYNSSKCKYFYSKNDPMPYKKRKRQYLQFLLKRLFKL